MSKNALNRRKCTVLLYIYVYVVKKFGFCVKDPPFKSKMFDFVAGE